MGMNSLRKGPRPDWFVLNDPDPAWVTANATVPGFQWSGNGEQITSVLLHRSHWPLLPVEVTHGMTAPDDGSLKLLELVARVEGHGIQFRPYQAADMPFLFGRRGTLLAYEMRLGKTLTSCAVHDPRDGMLVVVGPLASRDVWATWIERVHGFPPLILQGRQDVDLQPGYPAYFVHYDVLEAHTPFFANSKIATLILDEAHLLQNRKTKRVSAVSVLAPRSERIIALSGTPMWGSPDSLWALLHMITPGAWGGHHMFGQRYCEATPGAHGWTYGGKSNEDELRARLSEVMLRRTWRDVLGQLPPVTRVVEPVDVPITQLAAIEAAAMHASLARGTTTLVGYLATLRMKLAEVKVAPAVEAAARSMVDGHKVVVWSWHNQIGDKIAGLLAQPSARGRGRAAGIDLAPSFPVFRVRAEDDQTKRDEIIQAFRDCPGPAAIVVGIAIGGVAIDLSCADVAIFAELDWTPAMVYQAEMRTFAPTRPHAVTYLYADVPIESRLIQALAIREGFQASLGMGFDEIAKMVLGG